MPSYIIRYPGMTEKEFQELSEQILMHSTNGMEIQARIHYHAVQANDPLPGYIEQEQHEPESSVQRPALFSFTPSESLAPAFSNLQIASRTYGILVRAVQETFYDVDDILLTPEMFYSVEYSAAVEAIAATLRAALEDSYEIIQYFRILLAQYVPIEFSHVFTIDFSAGYNFIESDGAIWSENYLFWNYLTKRVLVFTLAATAIEEDDSDGDDEKELEDDNAMNEVFADAKFFTFE